ncbi:DUF4062 domain-containing protein (plasmid) [Catenovulum sp. SX2]|uniref:DUF4062 domain-containing protein n=1 Tax=Catenovulum sp. SX2 TaxID=3398614 RepID=UPI003F8414E0
MDKKYQVFVSSTYIDLLEERKEVIQALLELDCIPIGMELFPASDDDQWTFIKSVIDDCDYYVLVLAGRYGSCSESGIGYTEMEYRYAIESGKPVIAFLHKDPRSIPAKFTESDPELNKKLDSFRELAQKKLCKFWESPAELAGIVGRSIVQLKKRSPAVGWVKADLVPSEDSAQEILKLKNEIERLKEELNSTSSAGVNTDELSQGDDCFEFEYTGRAKIDYFEYHEAKLTAAVPWNTIFGALAPLMADEADEQSLQARLRQLLVKTEEDNLRAQQGFRNRELSTTFEHDVFDTIIVQFRALGFIQKSKRNRSVKDKKTYWCLTEKGDNLLVALKAIRKI